ncbi:capsid cement protein [Nocardia sp. NPDC050630]|uniref:capsid cement protein n=1 Tax=Nocardia sp. NPDC050630 TaxID=3364321 RepID=UPI0037BBA100
MPEYSPIFKPGQAVTRVTSATVTAGQALVVSGNNTVAASAAANSAFIGVALTDAASGENVLVMSGGDHDLTASGAIAAGARVVTAAAGAVADLAAGTDYSQVVGVATAAASGGKVRVHLFAR